MIKKYKPTSPGTRFRKTMVTAVSKERPEKSLIESITGPAGRNKGRISSRHRLRGHKKYYRIIDFKRNKFDIQGKITRIEYDPNRGPDIALVVYKDGEKRYIIAPQGLQVGAFVISSKNFVEPLPGNATIIKNIPLGAHIHNLEINIGAGAKLVRGAGNYGIIMAREGKYANIKLPSGEVKKISVDCMATVGEISNPEKRAVVLGKAGRARHLGQRPHIRGVAVANPKDHPHGGSYKDNGIGMSSPKSPWGWKTRGKKTRKRKITAKFMVSPRKKNK